MRSVGVFMVALAFSPIATATTTHAAIDSEEPSKPPVTQVEQRWYGLPIIATDVASDALFFVVPPLGLAGVTIAAPLIHVGHDHGGAALGSLGLRITAEAISLLWLVKNSIDCEDSCSSHSTIIALTPIMVAQVLDACLLAWKPPKRRTVRASNDSELSIAPTLTVLHLGGAIGFGGTF